MVISRKKRRVKKDSFIGCCLIWVCFLMACSANAVVLSEHPKLEKIAQELIAEKYYSRAELDAVFARANIQQSVLNAMQNPAEYKFTWGKYRKLLSMKVFYRARKMNTVYLRALLWQLLVLNPSLVNTKGSIKL